MAKEFEEKREVFLIEGNILPKDLVIEPPFPRRLYTDNHAQMTIALMGGQAGQAVRLVKLTDQQSIQVATPRVEWPHKRVVKTTISRSTSLGAGQSEVFELTPPPNTVARLQLLHVYILPPSGASSGNHTLSISYGSIFLDRLFAVYTYNNGIIISAFRPDGAVASYSPGDLSLWPGILKDIASTSDTPIWLTYRNNTDVATTRNRQIEVVQLYEEVDTTPWY